MSPGAPIIPVAGDDIADAPTRMAGQLLLDARRKAQPPDKNDAPHVPQEVFTTRSVLIFSIGFAICCGAHRRHLGDVETPKTGGESDLPGAIGGPVVVHRPAGIGSARRS